MRKRYRVILTEAERQQHQDLLAAGTAPARTLSHARILCKADQGPMAQLGPMPSSWRPW